jgi:hypothetical protein
VLVTGSRSRLLGFAQRSVATNINPLQGLRKGLRRHTSTGFVKGAAAGAGTESVLAQCTGWR